MKVTVICKSAYGDRPVDAVFIGPFEMSIIPRVGEYVCLFEGWWDSQVLNVVHDLESNTVSVEIDPDHTGEIAAELVRRSMGGEAP